MPAEYEPHDRSLMAWPTSTRRELWGQRYTHAEASFAAVARTINGFEPVLMVARPDDAAAARSYCGAEIEIVEMPIDDSWLRDSGPIFLVDDDGNLAAADFEFNSWVASTCRTISTPPSVTACAGICMSNAGAPRWCSRVAVSQSTAKAH